MKTHCLSRHKVQNLYISFRRKIAIYKLLVYSLTRPPPLLLRNTLQSFFEVRNNVLDTLNSNGDLRIHQPSVIMK